MPYHIESLQIHADDSIATTPDVASPLHLTTTYKYTSDPSKLKAWYEEGYTGEPIYSRISQPVSSRVEAVISKIIGADSVVYSSGLSAFNALMVHYNPKTVFVNDCYHGVVGILDIWKRNHNLKVYPLDADPSLLQPGDIIHVESPLNPTGVATDIAKFAKIAHERGAFLSVDATFAPPPLQDPFKWGADIVMHSATKYFGGHSDLLAGVLAVKDPKIAKELREDRDHLGTIVASMESWLLLRSLRTYSMRIKTQYQNAQAIVKFLSENKDKLPQLAAIYHADLQPQEPWLKEQLPLGGGPVFSILTTTELEAKTLPSKLKLFHHATSLGGIESLIEWRAMSDERVDRKLLRVSIGGENADDLIYDLASGLGADDSFLSTLSN